MLSSTLLRGTVLVFSLFSTVSATADPFAIDALKSCLIQVHAKFPAAPIACQDERSAWDSAGGGIARRDREKLRNKGIIVPVRVLAEFYCEARLPVALQSDAIVKGIEEVTLSCLKEKGAKRSDANTSWNRGGRFTFSIGANLILFTAGEEMIFAERRETSRFSSRWSAICYDRTVQTEDEADKIQYCYGEKLAEGWKP